MKKMIKYANFRWNGYFFNISSSRKWQFAKRRHPKKSMFAVFLDSGRPEEHFLTIFIAWAAKFKKFTFFPISSQIPWRPTHICVRIYVYICMYVHSYMYTYFLANLFFPNKLRHTNSIWLVAVPCSLYSLFTYKQIWLLFWLLNFSTERQFFQS